MKRFYLDRIGHVNTAENVYGSAEQDPERKKKLDEEREEYGCSSAETWALNETMLELLYERLMMYKEIGGEMVNLSYHKFEYKRKEYTQLELIDALIERLEFLLADKKYANKDYYKNVLSKNKYIKKYKEFDDWNNNQLELEKEVWEIWSIIFPAMWW